MEAREDALVEAHGVGCGDRLEHKEDCVVEEQQNMNDQQNLNSTKRFLDSRNLPTENAINYRSTHICFQPGLPLAVSTELARSRPKLSSPELI